MEVKVKKMAQAREHYGPLYRVAAFINNTLLTAGSDGIIAQWDKLDSNPTAFGKTTEQIFALTYSEKHGQVAVGSMPGHIHILNTTTKAEEHYIKYKKAAVYDIVYVGNKAITAHANGEIALWDAVSWELLSENRISTSAIRTLLVDVEGHKIYCGDSEGFITVVEIKDNQLNVITKWKAHELSVFTLLQNDSTLLVTAGRDAMLSLWDLSTPSTPTLLHKIPAHLATINHIISLYPLPLWASASRDKSVKIWEAPTGKLLKVLDNTKTQGHINSVNRLLWQAEHNYLYSCGDDATLIQWHIEI